MGKGIKILICAVIAAALISAAAFGGLYYTGMSGVIPKINTKKGQIKIACVGDSITYGHGIKNWSKNNYPAVLEKLMGSDYDVQNFGASGRAVQDNSDRPYTKSKQYRMSLDYNADIVIFMMGANDSKPENWHGEEAFKSAAEALIESYENQENKPEIYICIPSKAYFTDDKNGSLTNYDIQPEIVQTIAEIMNETAQEKGLKTININSLTEQNPQWFEKDGVHPNNDGAYGIAAQIKKTLEN